MPRKARPRRSASMRTPTPVVPLSDEDTAEAADSRAESPEDEENDDADTPAQDSEAAQLPSEPSSPVVQQFPRKRRLGRPPKNRPSDWNDSAQDAGSEGGTPVKRRRGRPGGGGFRGRARGGPSHSTRVPIDKEGNTLEVIDDEVDLPEDPIGETKVDKLGNLKEGRDYRVRVFTILGRGDRLYMLSTEPARCTGFRDSYLFFTKHMQLHKIIIDDLEKHDLIAREIIPHSYKGRAIGVVTARSVFREFGARIIVGGKKVLDDYQVTAALARGDVEGELADPNDRLPPPGEPYNKNQYVAWHGASAVYHTNTPNVPLQSKGVPSKRKVNITSVNWQVEHARAASQFNAILSANRRANREGVYDPHTNMMWYPKNLQPTHVKWEEVGKSRRSSHGMVNGIKELTNGVQNVDLDRHTAEADEQHASLFTPLSPLITRNYLVTDVVYQSAPLSGLGRPGPDGDYNDIGINRLADMSEDILSELPLECRQALEEVKQAESEWKGTWRDETADGGRTDLPIGFSGVPV